MPKDLLFFPSGKPRIDLSLCLPEFVEEMLEVLAACRARGMDYYPYCGFRSYAESFNLYQAWLNGTGGRAAPGGASQHNFGLAWDLAPDVDLIKPGLQPIWTKPAYRILGEEVAKRKRLHWGNTYNDSPHVGWGDFISRPRITQLDVAYRASKAVTSLDRMKDVWLVVRKETRV